MTVQSEYCDAWMAARGIATEVGEAAVQGDQEAVFKSGSRHDVSVIPAGKAFLFDGIDVVAERCTCVCR